MEVVGWEEDMVRKRWARREVVLWDARLFNSDAGVIEDVWNLWLTCGCVADYCSGRGFASK